MKISFVNCKLVYNTQRAIGACTQTLSFKSYSLYSTCDITICTTVAEMLTGNTHTNIKMNMNKS